MELEIESMKASCKACALTPSTISQDADSWILNFLLGSHSQVGIGTHFIKESQQTLRTFRSPHLHGNISDVQPK